MRDEHYILDLCDMVLKEIAARQHRFDFLRGDPGKRPGSSGRKLPVDGFYSKLNLVIEYHERQHSERVALFDDKMTCSRISRAEQRKIYDQRRREVLPENNIQLIEFSFNEFGHNKSNKRLNRNEIEDEDIIRHKLTRFLETN